MFVARGANAFCRTTTVPVVADFQPRPGRCWKEGLPLFWRSACVGYSVQRSASRQVDLATASEVAASAFSQWTAASCASDAAGSSRTSIDVRDLGPVDCAEVAYSQTSGNQNVIVFRDDAWPHHDGGSMLGLTTLSFNPDTGEIFDADMEINTADNDISVGDPISAGSYDLASILTHESGHFLGLSHSEDLGATMFASYDPARGLMRRLTSDDVAGICSIYRAAGVRATGVEPFEMPASACNPTPRRGFTTTCAEPLRPSCMGGGPQAARARADGWMTLGGILALAAIARRRRDPSGL